MEYSFLNDLNPKVLYATTMNYDDKIMQKVAFGYRTVTAYEVDYIVEGDGYIITNGVKYPAKRGALFFLTPGMEIYGIPSYRDYFLILDLFDETKKSSDTLELLNKIDYNRFVSPFPLMIMMHNPDYMDRIFNSLLNEYINISETSEFKIKSLLFQAFFEILNQVESDILTINRSKSYRENYKKINDVKDYINKNLKHHFNLDELCNSIGLSKYYFCSVFSEIVGLSPINYINLCRINKAKNMLLNTRQCVKEIAFECGFENEPYFYKSFKKIVGETPSEYAQKNKLWRF